MLDLNLNVLGSAQEDVGSFHGMFPEGSGSATQMDESGTSNSSVVNADASSTNDDSCSARASVTTFNFDILKVGGEDDVVVTKELFPVIGGLNNWPEQGQQYSPSSSARQNLIELGFDHGGPTEVRLVQQKLQQQAPPQQQVKKSRRGPRSRSSQYRGVTFYRRTGRWESHIWLVKF